MTDSHRRAAGHVVCPTTQLLELSALCLRCEVGDLLEDESCWSVFMACYNLYNAATDTRASGLLRDTAGNTLAHVVLMLFNCSRVSRHVAAAAAAAATSAAAANVSAAGGDGGQNSQCYDDCRSVGDGFGNDQTSALKAIDATSRDSDGASGGESFRAKPDARATAAARNSPNFWRGAGLRRERSVGGGAAAGATSTTEAGGGDGGEIARLTSHSLDDGAEEEPWPSVDGEADGVGGEESRQLLGDSRAALDGMSVGHGDVRARGVDGGRAVADTPDRERRASSENGGWRVESGTDRGGNGVDGAQDVEQAQGVLVNVMKFLSTLSDPRSNSSAECVLGLSLINIALEAGGADLGRIPALVRVMRGDLCKHLLQNSQTEDLDVLSLTLRVVFNLFNSIKDHLKVQLEVFLTRYSLHCVEVDYGGKP